MPRGATLLRPFLWLCHCPFPLSVCLNVAFPLLGTLCLLILLLFFGARALRRLPSVSASPVCLCPPPPPCLSLPSVSLSPHVSPCLLLSPLRLPLPAALSLCVSPSLFLSISVTFLVPLTPLFCFSLSGHLCPISPRLCFCHLSPPIPLSGCVSSPACPKPRTWTITGCQGLAQRHRPVPVLPGLPKPPG